MKNKTAKSKNALDKKAASKLSLDVQVVGLPAWALTIGRAALRANPKTTAIVFGDDWIYTIEQANGKFLVKWASVLQFDSLQEYGGEFRTQEEALQYAVRDVAVVTQEMLETGGPVDDLRLPVTAIVANMAYHCSDLSLAA